jgi:hypothetical protein
VVLDGLAQQGVGFGESGLSGMCGGRCRLGHAISILQEWYRESCCCAVTGRTKVYGGRGYRRGGLGVLWWRAAAGKRGWWRWCERLR